MTEPLNKAANMHMIEARQLQELLKKLKEVKNPMRVFWLGPTNAQMTKWAAVLEIKGKPRTAPKPTIEQVEDTKTET